MKKSTLGKICMAPMILMAIISAIIIVYIYVTTWLWQAIGALIITGMFIYGFILHSEED